MLVSKLLKIDLYIFSLVISFFAGREKPDYALDCYFFSSTSFKPGRLPNHVVVSDFSSFPLFLFAFVYISSIPLFVCVETVE